MTEYWVCGQFTQHLGVFAAKWPGPAPRLPWHVDLSGYTGSLTPAALLEAFRLAWLWWAEHAEITPVMVQTVGDALIRKHFAHIDGPSGVLAWSNLADNTNQPKTQRYDSGDSWILSEVMQGGIDLARVACHEIGHVLGLEHDGGSADALMRPTISEGIRKPRPRDVQRLLALGYKPRTTPLPSPTDPGPSANTIRFKTPITVGDHGNFALGSPVGIGDYMLLLTGEGPPPPVPDDVESRRTLRRLIIRAREEGRDDAAQQIEKAMGTLTIVQIVLAMAPFIIGLFSGQPIDWDAVVRALLDLFTAHGITS